MIRKLLSKILPPREKIFFSYFEENAEICHKCVDVLVDIIQQGISTERLSLARELKHNSNTLTKKTLTHLNATFITPIDREDIHYLNKHLNKIARQVVKVAFLFKTHQLAEYPNYLTEQSKTLVQAINELSIIVSKFRNFKKVNEIMTSNERMGEIETHGDEILEQAMIDLFSGKYDTLTVIKLRDIYNNIENTLDLCFSVSDAIVNIVLKHV